MTTLKANKGIQADIIAYVIDFLLTRKEEAAQGWYDDEPTVSDEFCRIQNSVKGTKADMKLVVDTICTCTDSIHDGFFVLDAGSKTSAQFDALVRRQIKSANKLFSKAVAACK